MFNLLLYKIKFAFNMIPILHYCVSNYNLVQLNLNSPQPNRIPTAETLTGLSARLKSVEVLNKIVPSRKASLSFQWDNFQSH